MCVGGGWGGGGFRGDGWGGQPEEERETANCDSVSPPSRTPRYEKLKKGPPYVPLHVNLSIRGFLFVGTLGLYAYEHWKRLKPRTP